MACLEMHMNTPMTRARHDEPAPGQLDACRDEIVTLREQLKTLTCRMDTMNTKSDLADLLRMEDAALRTAFTPLIAAGEFHVNARELVQLVRRGVSGPSSRLLSPQGLGCALLAEWSQGALRAVVLCQDMSGKVVANQGRAAVEAAMQAELSAAFSGDSASALEQHSPDSPVLLLSPLFARVEWPLLDVVL